MHSDSTSRIKKFRQGQIQRERNLCLGIQQQLDTDHNLPSFNQPNGLPELPFHSLDDLITHLLFTNPPSGMFLQYLLVIATTAGMAVYGISITDPQHIYLLNGHTSYAQPFLPATVDGFNFSVMDQLVDFLSDLHDLQDEDYLRVGFFMVWAKGRLKSNRYVLS